ncbi:MAG: DUF4339 domain-containing protein [Puniceicoccales bacterium]|jgi:hypothetical protein|nr:DUF4339 domain-containing protein [Puniceicoccales bacterium]
MESSATQEYVFFINNEVKGPLSRRDAEALAASGALTPDTPCAPVGAENWEPSSKFFSFNGQAASTESKEEPPQKLDSETTELDPFLRKKILQLGLATAATIDEYSREQAEAAVLIFEQTEKKEKKNKLIGGIGSGIATVVIVFLFGLTGPGQSLSNAVAGKFIKDSSDFLTERRTIASELNSIKTALATLNKTELNAPEGERPGKQFFEQRVVIPPLRANALIFQADLSKLAEISSETPYLVYFKDFTTLIQKEMLEQANLAWKFKHPAALNDPLDAVELAASWKTFKREAGEHLANFVKTSLQSRVAVTDIKATEFRVEGTRPENLAVLVEVKLTPEEKVGLPVYFPYKAQEIVKFSEPKRVSTTRSEALAFEVYTVKEKQQVGGTPYGIGVHFRGKDYFLERKTPVLYYLGVAREKIDRSPYQWVWVRVDEEFFNKTEPETKIPTVKLSDFRCNNAPKDSSMPSALRFKPKPKGEV